MADNSVFGRLMSYGANNPIPEPDWTGISEERRKKMLERWEKTGLVSPRKDGVFTELGQSLGGGLLDVGRGIGSAIEEATGYSGMRESFEDLKGRNRHLDPYEGYTAASIDPVNIARTVGSGVATTLPGAIVGTATTALTGGAALPGVIAGAGAMFSQIYGDRVKDYRERMPEQDELTVRNLAFASAVGESLLETCLGPEALARGIAKKWVTGALKETTKGLVKRVGKEAAMGFLTEGSEEVMQDLWDRICLRAGTENVSLPTWDEVKEQFMGGAWSGLVLGGAGGAVEHMGSRRGGQNGGPSSPVGSAETNPSSPVGEAAASDGRYGPPLPNLNGEAVPGAGAKADMMGAKPEVVLPTPDESQVKAEHSVSSRLAEAVANEIGLKFRFLDEEGAPEAVDDKGNPVSGWYDDEKDEYWIDRKDLEANPLKTLGHEFKHFLDLKHPDLAKQFDELVKAGMTEKGKQALSDVEAEYQGGGYAPGQGNAEFSADTMGEVWLDPDHWRDFAARADKQELGLGEKFLEAVQEFIKIVRAKLKEIGTPEAKEMFDNFGALKKKSEEILLEVKRRNGTSTEAENVVGVKGSDTVQSIPLSELGIDPARFQFKSKANKETGVDESNQIGGEWDPKTAGNLYVWEDKAGKKFVVNGHHRYQLAKEKGVEKVNAIVDREADGVTAEQARRNGVLINIRDEQGDVRDYAEFVRHEKMDEETAAKEGVLNREKGKRGFLIGRYASDNLYSLYRNGEIGDAKASTIADVARGDESLESAGIKAAKTMPNAQLAEFLKCLKTMPRVETEQGDLFGFDDSALQTAEKLSKLAAKHIREIDEKLRAVKQAIKNPETAAKGDVKVGKNAQKIYDQTIRDKAEWEHWYTNPELTEELRREAGLSPRDERGEMKDERGDASSGDAGAGVASRDDADAGRFNMDSETPLLSDAEDANDFQLTAETPAEAAARDRAAEREKEEKRERADKEAERKAPELEFGNDERGSSSAKATEDMGRGRQAGERAAGVKENLTTEEPVATEPKDIYGKIREAKEGSPARVQAFLELPDGEHELGGKKFTKVGNIFERDGQKLNARGIERSFKDVPKSDAADEGAGKVPSNYKTFNEKGDWELSKSLDELQNDFVSALNNEKHLRIETPKGNAHMMKAGEGFIFEGVNGKIYRWDDSAIRNMLARFITSPNPDVRIIEESAAQHFADRRILRDGSLLRAGDYAAFGKTKEHPSLYTGQVVSIGKKNVKLKTRSDMYGEQVLTLPWSDYKAHYPKSEVSLSGNELEEFQAEHGGSTPKQFDQAKISFMEQRLNREGREEREITSAAGKRAEARTKREVENFVGDSGRQYSLKRGEDGRAYYQIPFAEGLKRVVDPAQKENRNPIYVRDTPKVFRDIGFTALPMIMNARHLRLNFYTAAEFKNLFGSMRQGEHAHGLHDMLKSLPKALENPLAIVVNKAEHAKPGSVVAITGMDVQGKKIVVPVLIEAESNVDGTQIDSHLVLTVYDESDWIKTFLNPALDEEKKGIGVFYFNEEKAARYSALSNRKGAIPTGLVHTIAQAGIIVKPQTKTLQFKRWFGDSKVVDENGEPLVVYRGAEFDPLAQEPGKGIIRPEAYFTADPEYAKRYARNGGEVREYYLNIRRPFDIRDPECLKDLQSVYPDHEFQRGKSGALDWGEASIVDGEFLKENFGYKYDGIIYDEGGDQTDDGPKHRGISYVPLDGGTQVKSATDNIGTFDGKKPDIRYRLKRKVNPVREEGELEELVRQALDKQQDRFAEEKSMSNEDAVKKAEAWIKEQGGYEEAILGIARGKKMPPGSVRSEIMNLIFNSPDFKKLSRETQKEFTTAYGEHTSYLGQELQALRKAALTLDTVENVNARIKEYTDKMGDKAYLELRNHILKELGIDIADLPSDIVKDKRKLDALLRETITRSLPFFDALPKRVSELWINFLLSGLRTHLINTGSNFANIAYELGPKRFTEALINVIARRKDAATFGEFKEIFRFVDWKRAKEGFQESFDLEVLSPENKLDTILPSIPGKTGRTVRTPGRLLKAADRFAREILVPIEAASHAYREASAKGLTGEERREFIRAQLSDVKSAAIEYGKARASEITFTDDVPKDRIDGKIIRYLIGLKNEGGVTGMLVNAFLPFIKVPYNITRQTVRKSPLGAVNLVWQTGKALAGKRKVDNQFIQHTAEQVLVWGATGILLSMSGDGDDDPPVITGTGANYGSSERNFNAQNLPPNSIRIGEKWYDYSRIEPLSDVLSSLGNVLEAYRSNKPKAYQKAFTKTVKSLADKSYFSTFREVFQLLEADEYTLRNSGANYISSWVPNLVRQFALYSDDYMAEQRGADFFDLVKTRSGFRTLAPKVDYFGRDIPRDIQEGTGGSWLWRFAPWTTREVEYGDEADRLLRNYNQQNPDNAYWVSRVGRVGKWKGEKISFSGDDYHDLCREAGELAHRKILEGIRRGFLNVEHPGEKDIELVKKVIARARRETREKFIREGRFEKEEEK